MEGLPGKWLKMDSAGSILAVLGLLGRKEATLFFGGGGGLCLLQGTEYPRGIAPLHVFEHGSLVFLGKTNKQKQTKTQT